MKENDSLEELSDPVGKSQGWRKMPGRLFSHKDKERKSNTVREQQTQDDLDAFLKPSTENAAAYAAQVAQRPARPLAPKIDVSAAQRFPGAQTVAAAVDSDRAGDEKPFRYTKPPRRSGLRVGFANTPPEYIGYGGDESEDPVLEIARRRRQRHPGHAQASSGQHQVLEHRRPQDIRQAAEIQNMTDQRQPPDRRQQSDTAQQAPQLPPRPSPVSPEDFRLPEDPRARGQQAPMLPDITAQPPLMMQPVSSDPKVSPEWVARESDRIVDMLSYSLESQDPGPDIPKIKRAATGFNSIHDADYPLSDDGSRASSVEMQSTEHLDTIPLSKRVSSEVSRENSPSRRISQIDPTQRIGLKKMREDEGRAFITAKSPTHSHRPTSSQSSLPQQEHLDPSMAREPRRSFETASVQSPPSIRSVHSPPVPSPASTDPRTSTIPSPPLSPPQMYGRPGTSSAPRSADPSPRPMSREHFGSPKSSVTSFTQPVNSSKPPAPPQPRERVKAIDPRARPSPLHDFQAIPTDSSAEPLTSHDHEDAEKDAHQSQLRDAAFFEFASSVSHMRHVFRLSAQADGPVAIRNLKDWVRAAYWWLLVGRDGLEKALRSKGNEGMEMRYSPGRTTFSPYLQHHLNLAKAWWIASDVISSRIETLKSSREAATQDEIAEADETRNDLVDCLKKLALSLSKRGAMPQREALSQGVDNSIWIRYPEMPQDASWILSDSHHAGKSAAHIRCDELPISDTDDMFCMGRFAVSVLVLQADFDGHEHQIQSAFPCILTLFRRSNCFQPGMMIASQSSLVNVIVQDSNTYGATWEHVRWESQTSGLRVKLPRKFRLKISMSQGDFHNMWGAFDYSQKVNSSMQKRPDEKLIQKWTLTEFAYTDTMHSTAFPDEPLLGCNLSLFERSVTTKDAVSPSKKHCHYRLAVVTNPASKLLRSVSVDISRGMPVQYVYSRTARGEPHLQFLVNETNRYRHLSLAFADSKQRDYLRDCVVGRALTSAEGSVAMIPDVSFTVSPEPTGDSVSVFAAPIKLDFLSCEVINATQVATDHSDPPVVQSESLRAILQGKNGTIVDRMNFTPSELRIRLDVDMSPSLKILRTARFDVTLSMGPHAADPAHFAVLQRIQHTLAHTPTVNIYTFRSYPDLFAFQHALTGFAVIYDGRANSFAISRRRMIVPVYKKWDTDRARIQIVQAGDVIQLLAFFEGYNLAEAFNFQLRATDQFEKISGSHNTPAIKLANAKFSLPLPNSDREREGEKTSKYVNLDMLENPGESEDITIGFETAEERDRFAGALPAAASMGKKFTLMRRI